MTRFLFAAAFMQMLCASAHAEEMCDMQHQCYHGDLEHPDRVTPPPAPQYARPTHPLVVMPPAQAAPACHLFKVRNAPFENYRIMEICQMSAGDEAAIRARTSMPMADR